MTDLLVARTLAILLCAFGAAAWLWAIWHEPELCAALSDHRRRLDDELGALRKPRIGRLLLSMQLSVCSLSCALAALTHGAGWLLAAMAAWLGPQPWLSRRRARRLTALESQLDPWLLALANALRATPSLGEALASTATLVTSPLRDEIEQILKEWRLGVPLDRAMQSAGERIGSRTLSAALLTLRIARASGGGVSACLESAAAALREMSRLDAVVRSKTAEGKAQALVISVLPFPFVALLHWLDPTFLAPLLATPIGHALLGLCASLWLAALLLARRIVRVDL